MTWRSAIFVFALITTGCSATSVQSESVANNLSNEATVRDIPVRMRDAWNKGSADDFAAPFDETADFIAFEGTHLKGRQAIVAFHKQIFETVVKGSRLVDAEVKSVRFLDPETAVMHATVKVVMPGETAPSPSRDSMQLFVVRKRHDLWKVEAMQNSRSLTLEHQKILDDLEALPEASRKQVADLLATLGAKR